MESSVHQAIKSIANDCKIDFKCTVLDLKERRKKPNEHLILYILHRIWRNEIAFTDTFTFKFTHTRSAAGFQLCYELQINSKHNKR